MPYLGPPPASKLASAADIESGAVDSDEIAAGAVDIAHLSATGTAGSGNYLRGDNSWTAVSGGLASGDVIPADDGSVGAPGLSFADDTDNGLYRIGADNFGVAVAGALAMEFDPIGAVNMPLQPGFLAIGSSGTNVTGDGTTFTFPWGSEVFDQNSDFNLSTETFTAPVAGRYQVNVVVDVTGVVSGHTHHNLNIIASNRSWGNRNASFGGMGDGAGEMYVHSSALLDMDAADTLYVTFVVTGGTKTVDINPTVCYLAVHLAF